MSYLSLQFFSLKPSRCLKLYLLVLHGLVLIALLYSLAVIWPNAWSPALLLLLATMIIVGCALHAFHALNTYCNRRGAEFIRGLSYANQQWQLHIGRTAVSVILKQATVWSWLIVLHFYSEVEKRHYPVVIVADSVSADQHRRMRVLLRHIVSW